MRFLVLATALMSVISAAAHAAVQVRLDVRTQVDPPAGAKGESTDARSTIELTLGDRFFIVRAEGRSIVHDLQRRTRTVIDHASRTRVDHSLFDTVGARSHELKDRVGRSRFFASAGLDQGSLTTVDHEHALGIQDEASTPLDTTRDGADQVFSHARRVLMRRSIKGTAVSAPDSLMWAQFIRYRYGGHPQILADIGRAETIPASTVLVMHQDKVTTRHSIVVSSVQPVDAKPVEVSSFARRPASASGDPLDRALDRGTALPVVDLAVLRQRQRDAFDAAMRDDRKVLAFLCFVEWKMVSGETLLELTPAQRAALLAGPSSDSLRLVIASETVAEKRKALGLIAALRDEAGDRLPFLKVVEGSLRRRFGDRRAARALFLEALEADARLTGVYKDLGDMLLADGEAPRAWRSWDIGRRLAPQHYLFFGITELEQTLAKQHPEYF